MRILTPDGLRVVAVATGSGEASLIGAHWNAIKIYRDSGDTRYLDELQDATIDVEGRPVRLETDPRAVKRWAKQGELDIDDPYAELEGDR